MRVNFVIGGQQLPLSTDTLNPYTVDPKHLLMIVLFALAEITILFIGFRFLPVFGLPKSSASGAQVDHGTVAK